MQILISFYKRNNRLGRFGETIFVGERPGEGVFLPGVQKMGSGNLPLLFFI